MDHLRNVFFVEEHERLREYYSTLDQKLQQTLSEHSASENTIQELKVCFIYLFIIIF